MPMLNPMAFRLGPLELGLILVIIFILFGAGKLPQLIGSIGKSVRSFREGQAAELEDEEEEEEEVKPRKKKKTTKKSA